MIALLGDLVEITGGGTPSRKVAKYWDGNIPWATVKDFKSLELKTPQESISSEGLNNSASNMIPAGSIIIPTRMAVGKAAINRVDMAINQDLKALRIKNPKKVDRDYLFLLILNQSAYLERRGKGATVKGITLDVLREMKIPLPPLEEQKRIAAILDKADAIRRKRQQAIDLTDQLLRSVFLEMFGDPVTNPMGWKLLKLGDLLAFLTSGSRGWARYYSDDGTPFLRIQNVGKNQLLKNDLAFVCPPVSAESKRTRVQAGDVILSITADLGRTAVIPENFDAHINQHLAILRTSNIEPIFLSQYLASEGAQRQIQRLNRGGVKAGLNFDDIRSFLIPLPPPGLQKKFRAFYDKIISFQNALNKKNTEIGILISSLTQRAFRGELGQQSEAA